MNTNEIVKALRCMHAFEGAPSDMTCGDCEYYESFSGTIVDSEDDGCPGLCNGKFCVQAADTIERLQKELDAAIADIHEADRFRGHCFRCKSWNGTRCKRGYSVNASFCNNWQWRGRESEET